MHIENSRGLSRACSIQIGRPDEIWLPETAEELVEVASRLPILGRGSNVVLRASTRQIVKTTRLTRMKIVETGNIFAECGVSLQKLIRFGIQHHLGGIEFLASVPGTVGGAVFMNAGRGSRYPNLCTASFLKRALVWDGNDTKWINHSDLRFEHRRSIFHVQPELVILGAEFKLPRKSPDDIRRDIRSRMDFSSRTQDLRFPNAGSIFSHGYRWSRKIASLSVGPLRHSHKTPNWFVNSGGATSEHFVKLVKNVSDCHATPPTLEVRII